MIEQPIVFIIAPISAASSIAEVKLAVFIIDIFVSISVHSPKIGITLTEANSVGRRISDHQLCRTTVQTRTLDLPNDIIVFVGQSK